MARATATFRVKLKRLLDPSRLGEIQNQVTREIARVNDAAITHTRRRACCMGTQHASKTRARTQRQVARGSKLRSSTPTVRVHTADLSLEKRKPSIPERAPTVMPISGRKTLRNAHAVSAAFQLAKGGMPTCRQPVPHRGSGIGDGRDELLRPKLISAEQKLASNGIADASNQEIPESLHETGADCSSSEVSSPDRHLRETSSSDEEFDGEWSNGSPRGPCSSDNGLISSSGDDEGVLSPAISCGEEKSKPAESSRREESNRGENCSSSENEAKGGRVISGKQKPRNTCRRNRKSRRRARGSHKKNGGEAATCSRVALDEAWSNRSLTVLLTDLGLYQSCQRTALSKHMPAGLKGDAIGEGKRGRSPPPRIDRPHFRPAFVELPAAGKGRTLLMCPEPVAPGYEYSDIFEEVVKLHPPAGQLVLEEIARGSVVTRSDALAHVESFERGSDADQVELLVSEFLEDPEIREILASAESPELDLAKCVEDGTLFDKNVP